MRDVAAAAARSCICLHAWLSSLLAASDARLGPMTCNWQTSAERFPDVLDAGRQLPSCYRRTETTTVTSLPPAMASLLDTCLTSSSPCSGFILLQFPIYFLPALAREAAERGYSYYVPVVVHNDFSFNLNAWWFELRLQNRHLLMRYCSNELNLALWDSLDLDSDGYQPLTTCLSSGQGNELSGRGRECLFQGNARGLVLDIRKTVTVTDCLGKDYSGLVLYARWEKRWGML